MATSTVVPLSEYLRTSYSPDCDWIDGEVRERNMGEGPHSAIQKFFITFLSARERDWSIRVWPEHRVQVGATRFRIPDVCVTHRSGPFERIICTPPLLCIEVLSSEDRMNRVQERINDYFAMGVRTAWVIDPWKRGVLTAANGLPLASADASLIVPGTLIDVPIPLIFSELDELEGRS